MLGAWVLDEGNVSHEPADGPSFLRSFGWGSAVIFHEIKLAPEIHVIPFPLHPE